MNKSPITHHASRITHYSLLVTLLIFLSTIQTDINGSEHAYATDVGEIQNALARWGTLHQTGYPLFSLSGSIFVTALRGVGIAPAFGASLYSMLWGLISIWLMMTLARELGATPRYAALGAIIAALSTSFWVDASLAELHTFTIAFSLATLLYALRFGRTGKPRDLFWLTFWGSQGIAHQRAVAFLGIAVLLLIAPQLRIFWRELPRVIGIALLAPLTYLYLPIRDWMGAEWVFASPGTWVGFTKMILDTKVDRVVRMPASDAEWLERAAGVVQVLGDDLPLVILAVGLAGLLIKLVGRVSQPADSSTNAVKAAVVGQVSIPAAPSTSAVKTAAVGQVSKPATLPASEVTAAMESRPTGNNTLTALALTTAWAAYIPLCLIIWEGRVSDALLAVKLPIVMLAGIGLALLCTYIGDRVRWGNLIVPLLLIGAAGWLFVTHRPAVLAITRDTGAEEVIARANLIPPLAASRVAEGHETYLMALWGRDYWALAYARDFRHKLSDVDYVIYHNISFRDIIQRGDRFLTPSRVLYKLPLDYWDRFVGHAYLSTAAPGIVEISTTRPVRAAEVPDGAELDLENGFEIISADLMCVGENGRDGDCALWQLTVYWQAQSKVSFVLHDYSVAVHLLTHDPPRSPADIFAQADRAYPVDGWYPTTRWGAGETVRDHYLIEVPPNTAPVAIRVGMYRVADDGQFLQSPWLTLNVRRETLGKCRGNYSACGTRTRPVRFST